MYSSFEDRARDPKVSYSCPDFHLLLLLSFSKHLPSSASQHLCPSFVLPVPQLLPQRYEEEYFILAAGKHVRVSLLDVLAVMSTSCHITISTF